MAGVHAKINRDEFWRGSPYHGAIGNQRKAMMRREPRRTIDRWSHDARPRSNEMRAERQQLEIPQRTRPRQVRLAKTDRCLWVLLAHLWTVMANALVIVQPETVIGWHREGLRLGWTWKRRRRMGGPPCPSTSAR